MVEDSRKSLILSSCEIKKEIEYFLHIILDVFTLTFQKGRTGIKYVNTELIKRKHSKENSKS